jgi:putative MATE family efflux protein
MTKGGILPQLLKFMAPVVLGNLFQQLYNLTDMFIAGRFLGANAVAAVGSVGSLMFLLIGFMMGLTSGCAVVTGQRFGAGDYEGVKNSVVGAAIISVIMAIAGTLVGVFTLDAILRAMRMPADIYADGRAYIRIIYLGLAANMLYNIVASLMRAVGNSKAPLYFLMLAAALNVVLDILFIAVLHMGVEGTALATVIGQGVSGAASLIYMIKKTPILRVSVKHWIPDFKTIRKQIAIGAPMAVQFSITAAGIIVIQSALNTFGVNPVAGYAAAMKVDQVIEQPIFALGATMAIFAAQNTGAKLPNRIKKGALIMIGMVMLYGVFSIVVSRMTIEDVTRFLISGESEERIRDIIFYANIYTTHAITFTFILGILMLARNALQGCGYSLFPMIGSIIELVSRSYFATAAAARGDFGGVCLAQPITWGVTSVFLWAVFAVIFLRGPSAPKRSDKAVISKPL